MIDQAHRGIHAERAAEKQAERELDLADIREGRRSVDQVNHDNALMHGLLNRFRVRRELGVR